MNRNMLILGGALAIALAIVAALFVSVGPRFLSSAPPVLSLASFPADQQAVVARINAAPEYTRFFQRLGEAFPKDRARLLEGFAAKTADAPALAADTYLAETVRHLGQTRGVLAAKASPAALTRIFALQADMAAALAKEDARLCVDIIYGGESQGYYEFAANHRALVAAYARAGLDAIIDGQASKTERDKPSDADFKELEAALAKAGLSQVQIDAFLDGKLPDPPQPDADLCRAGLVYFDVLKGLPEPLRLRIYALTLELMAK